MKSDKAFFYQKIEISAHNKLSFCNESGLFPSVLWQFFFLFAYTSLSKGTSVHMLLFKSMRVCVRACVVQLQKNRALLV